MWYVATHPLTYADSKVRADYGTLPNQTLGNEPAGAFTKGGGDPYADDHLSFLPGQRLSRCTCNGGDHPGPKHSNGEYVGRAAPEIDVFESQVSRAYSG